MLTYPHYQEWIAILWGRDAGLGLAGIGAALAVLWLIYGRWLWPQYLRRIRLGLLLAFFLSFVFVVLIGKG